MGELHANVFTPWVTGSKREPIFVGDPDGKPFVVQGCTGTWLPINVLIYAQDEQDALQRVRDGFNRSLNLTEENYPDSITINRLRSLQELINQDKYVTVKPLNKTYVSQIGWDERGYC